FGKFSNDTQENPKDAQKSTSFQEKYTKPTETTDLTEKNQKLTAEKENLTKEKTDLTEKNKALTTDKDNLTKANTELKTEKENLTNQLNTSQKQVQALEQSQQVLENEKAELTNENTKLKAENTGLTNKITGLSTDKENLTKDKTELAEKNQRLTTEKTELNNKITGLVTEKERLSTEKENLTKANAELKTENDKLNQASQKLNELERKHAPYQKLEKLYEVFLEVKDRLNFNFVATTHSAMDLIASVLSDSKYYLESLYKKAQEELSDKSEKLAELFDLLFEYIKDSKFERLKEPSAYDYSCKTLYPEQNSSQKIQRVVLRGYKHNDKVYHTIVDMGS
ncbi:hypothetical protein, partial [Helicobacter pylori]|uniref:hypothetical protein n=1 Tax=Helicobacter pylori TaxID=210 RepID=UPI002159DF4E